MIFSSFPWRADSDVASGICFSRGSFASGTSSCRAMMLEDLGIRRFFFYSILCPKSIVSNAFSRSTSIDPPAPRWHSRPFEDFYPENHIGGLARSFEFRGLNLVSAGTSSR